MTNSYHYPSPAYLSIGIPIYKTRNILQESFYLLFSNADFDNYLIDDTAGVIKKYALVKYYTTKKKIEDAKFILNINKKP